VLEWLNLLGDASYFHMLSSLNITLLERLKILLTLIYMQLLDSANELLLKIAKSYPNITPITTSDIPLFDRFLENEDFTYGNAWTYITQGLHGTGPNNLGYKYYDGESLCAFCIYPKIEQPDLDTCFWVRPMGEDIEDKIGNLAQEFRIKYGIPSYFKKLNQNQFKKFKKLGFQEVVEFPWHTSAPKEDDTYEECIIDINNTMNIVESLGRTRQLSRAYRHYLNYLADPSLEILSIYDHKDECKAIARRFFIYQEEIGKENISTATDYYNMIDNEILGSIQSVIFFNKKPIAFYFAQKQSPNNASLYSMLTLREISNNITDFTMFHLFDQLSKQGINILNLGGSEHKELDDFKRKFRPASFNTMYWACLHL